MGCVLRLILVWAITIALTASAAAWSHCPEIQSIALAVGSHSPSHHDHATGAQHNDHQMHHQRATGEPPSPGDHDCMKCCAICMTASALLPTTVETTSPSVSAVVFRPDHEYWSGNTIAIDPGIPKRIA